MKKYIFFFILFYITIGFSKAQTGIFTTYKNYLNGEIKLMDEMDINQDVITGLGKITITSFKCKKDGQKIKYKPNEIWGFLYKGQLFRCSANDFFYILENGKVILYANGWAAYDQIKNEKSSGIVYGKDFYFMSNDLTTLIYDMPWGDANHKATIAQKLRYKDFMLNYPQHKELYDCINGATDFHTAEFCIQQYNERAKTD
jgi:hypothetical protein